jgi:KaiC/GvpD/RAD55 family RecA-like ATPase
MTDLYEKNEKLKIIDWYSWRKTEAEPEQDSNSIIKAEGDLSKLWMAVEKALLNLSYSPIKCAVSNILSPALSIFDFDQVYLFVKEMVEKFNENDITSMYVIEKESHDPMELAKLRALFDGVIDIDIKREDDKVNRKVRILFMHGTDFDPEYKELILDGTKIMVNET